jgi:hypothetical protein
MGKKIKIRIRDEHTESYFRELGNFFEARLIKFFDEDKNPGIFLTMDSGWK